MAIVFGYTPATNIVVVTGGTAGTPATFADFVTADRAGNYTVMDAIATAMNLVLDRLIRPVEFRALKITFTLAGTNAGAGDTVDITGTDAWGNAQNESINVAAGNGAYVSAKYWRTITDIDCTGFADGVGTITATQPQWGVIWDFGNGQYTIDAIFIIGNGAASTYFRSRNEDVYFSSLPNAFTDYITANATLELGQKVGTLETINGSSWRLNKLVAGWTAFRVPGVLKMYDSKMTMASCADTYHIIIQAAGSEIINSVLEKFKGFFQGGNVITLINVRYNGSKPYGSGLLEVSAASTITNMSLHGCQWAITLAWGDGLYIVNPSFEGNTYDLYFSNYTDTGYLINPVDFDPTKVTYTGVNTGSAYEQYTCNIKITDKDGTLLDGVTVLCEDQYGAQAFSELTGATNPGEIDEQNVSYRRYYYSGSAQITTYSPHKFTISKAGYETIVLDEITIDAPIVWHLELLPALAASDVRDGLSFLEDRVGTLDLPAIADVEKGVQFDNLTKTGTFKSPAEADVRDGEGYGEGDVEFTGALDLPSINDVEDGVFFDGATKEGNFEAPAEEDVEVGVGYGSLGTEFEGTYLGLRGENLIAVLEESVALVGYLEKKVDLTGELKP